MVGQVPGHTRYDKVFYVDGVNTVFSNFSQIYDYHSNYTEYNDIAGSNRNKYPKTSPTFLRVARGAKIGDLGLGRVLFLRRDRRCVYCASGLFKPFFEGLETQ